MKLLKVDSLESAREKLLNVFKDYTPPHETVTLERVCGRTAYCDVYTSENIPAFRRSTVDGFAVLSKDTAAAGESIPVLLKSAGQVEMGSGTDIVIKSGFCAEVPTGGIVPDGADAVVMLEYAEAFGDGGIALYQSAAYGENVINIGEDAKSGALLLQRGRKILPQDVGALAAFGITNVQVYAPIKITILSTGDELISPSKTPEIGQVRDINTYALKALAEKCGFEVVGVSVLPDNENAIEQAVRMGMDGSDIVAVSGGSSQGKKDATSRIFDKVSDSGVFTHGLALKPGKPTILAYDKTSRTLLAGLPGHPVSAIIVFELLLGWLYRELSHSVKPPAIPARIASNVAASPGKLTCLPVKLEWNGDYYTASPLFGKSGLITTLTTADGYCTIERDKEGLILGETVLVHLF